MKNNYLFRLTLLTALILLIAGCGGGKSSSGPPGSPGNPTDPNQPDTIIAGGAKYEYQDGVGKAAAFCNLKGIIIDGSGNIYVTDENAIRKLTFLADGSYEVKTIAGTYNKPGYSGNCDGINAIFNRPHGLAVDSKGDLYVADTGNHIIRKLTKNNDGTYSDSLLAGCVLVGEGISGHSDTKIEPPQEAFFNGPFDITLIEDYQDGYDCLFVTDSGNYTIRKIIINYLNRYNFVSTVAGKATESGTADGDPTNARFDSPFGITCNKITGDLFVTDGKHTIRQLKKESNYEVLTIAGIPGVNGSIDGPGKEATFSHPYGITLDNFGNLYVTDYTPTYKIRKIAGNDHYVTTIRNTGALPTGITTDNKGNLYYCNSIESTIVKVNLQ